MREIVKVSGKGVQWREKVFIYPEEAVVGQEVMDRKAAEKAINEWVNKEMKGKVREARVQIGEDLIFRKMVAEKDVETFWSEVPIDPEKMAKLTVKKGDQYEAAATNQELLELATEGLTSAHIRAVEIEPKFSIKKPEVVPEEKKMTEGGKSQTKTIVMAVMLLAVLILMGVVLWKSRQTNTSEAAVPVLPTITQVRESPTAVPTKAVKVETKKLKIEILNGSGVAGKAAEVRNFLASLGYMKVTVGNAEQTDQATSEARLKPEAAAVWQELGADLRSKYPVASEAGELDANSIFDAVITLGND